MADLNYKISKDKKKLFLFCEKEKYECLFNSLMGQWETYDNKDQFVLSINYFSFLVIKKH